MVHNFYSHPTPTPTPFRLKEKEPHILVKSINALTLNAVVADVLHFTNKSINVLLVVSLVLKCVDVIHFIIINFRLIYIYS